jgi:four helix bundle protein
MNKEGLKQRTKEYSLQIIKLIEALPNNTTAWAISKQLVKSGTSVGANYRAVCRSRSEVEFVARL